MPSITIKGVIRWKSARQQIVTESMTGVCLDFSVCDDGEQR